TSSRAVAARRGGSSATRNAGGSSRVVGTLQPLDVDEGGGDRCRVGLRASCMLYNLATYRIGAVTERSSHSIRRGLLSVAAAGVAPDRPGAWLKAWVCISLPYRKLGSGTKRKSSRVPLTKRHRCAVSYRAQNRSAEHRCDEALSAERQRTAELQTKHHPAATCTSAPARISARSECGFEPLAFPLPTSFSRLYAHLRASVQRRRVPSTRGVGEQGKTAACCHGLGCTAARETPDQRG